MQVALRSQVLDMVGEWWQCLPGSELLLHYVEQEDWSLQMALQVSLRARMFGFLLGMEDAHLLGLPSA